jgi:hypothetical protein
VYKLDQKKDRVEFIRADKLNFEYLKLSTGYSNFDYYVGNLELSQVYLFYGHSFLDEFVHRLIVRASKSGTVVFIGDTTNNIGCDGISKRRLVLYAKKEGTDPRYVFGKILFINALNGLKRCEDATNLIQRVKYAGRIRLILVHNVTKLLNKIGERKVASEKVNSIISGLWQLCLEHKIILVITAMPRAKTKYGIPNPDVTTLMMHLARVVVFFCDRGNRTKAYVVKHNSFPTPFSVEISRSIF